MEIICKEQKVEITGGDRATREGGVRKGCSNEPTKTRQKPVTGSRGGVGRQGWGDE